MTASRVTLGLVHSPPLCGVVDMLKNWAPDSWREFPVVQVPDYEDKAKLEAVEKRLGRLPAAGFCRRGPQAEA